MRRSTFPIKHRTSKEVVIFDPNPLSLLTVVFLPPMRDYYRILGIRPDATREEIKDAWNFSVKAFHPDKFAASSPRQQALAQERTKAINEVYEVLYDPIRRANYDRRSAREHPPRTPAAPPSGPPPPPPPPPTAARGPSHTASSRDRKRPTPPRKP